MIDFRIVELIVNILFLIVIIALGIKFIRGILDNICIWYW